jgi:hypothetical protein
MPSQPTNLAQFFSQNFHRDSRQVCRPSAKIADKFVGLVPIFSATGLKFEKYQHFFRPPPPTRTRSKQRSWGVGGKKNEADGLLRVLRVSAKTKQTKKLVFFKLRENLFYFTKQAMLFFQFWSH